MSAARRLRHPRAIYGLYALFVAGAVALAIALFLVDVRAPLPGIERRLPRIDTGTMAAATGLVLTMATVAFSTVVVALVLISNQFAPRVLVGFMRDPWLNFFLAGFIGAFIYCVVALVLPIGPGAAPSLTYFAVLATCALCACFFFAFMFYVVGNINIARIIERVAAQTKAEIRQMCPDEWRDDDLDADLEEEVRAPAAPRAGEVLVEVQADRSGYVQQIDAGRLERVCRDPLAPPGLTLYEEFFVGQFVLERTPIARYTASRRCGPDLEAEILRAFTVQGYRTIHQDIAFGLRELVDVAVKASSPDNADPTTAENCIDYLGVALAELGRRRPPQHRVSLEGEAQPRVYMRRLDFARLVRFSFDQILHFGAHNPKVVERMVFTIGRVAEVCKKRPYVAAFLDYVSVIEDAIAKDRDTPAFARVRRPLARLREDLEERLGRRPET